MSQPWSSSPGAARLLPDEARDPERDPIARATLEGALPDATHPQVASTSNRLAMLSDTVLPALFLGGLAYAAWMIVAPFLAALTWAVMVAYATYPLYERLRALLRGRVWELNTDDRIALIFRWQESSRKRREPKCSNGNQDHKQSQH